MNSILLIKQIIEIIGYIATILLIVSGVLTFIAWLRGILTPLWRLGNGLAKRKITIFAKDNNKESFKNLLLGSNLFKDKNIQLITKSEDFGSCEKSTLFLVVWSDFNEADISNILNKKTNETALIIFAENNQLQSSDRKKLDQHRNVTVANFRGRLMNDILISLMTSGYEKR